MPMRCLKCHHDADGQPLQCPKCGAVYAKLQALAAAGQTIRAVQPVGPEERERARLHQAEQMRQRAQAHAQELAHARRTGQWAGVAQDLIVQEAAAVVLATTDQIAGREIEEVRGIVAADYAYAFGAIFEEVAGLVRNIAGSGRSQQTIQYMEKGRAEALHLLKFKTLDLGANAVVGIHIDYEEFSGANQRGILVVIATGTAVRLRPSAQTD